MLTSAALYALLTTCAPNVQYQTMASIARVESGFNPYAVGDNTTGQSYMPGTYGEAIRIVSDLISRGHSVDMGIVQVNSLHLRDYGLSIPQLLAPCTNARIGGVILGDAYARAANVFGPGRIALAHAISAYNTGSLYAGAPYVRKVVNAAIEMGFIRSQRTIAIAPVSAPIPRLMPTPMRLASVVVSHSQTPSRHALAPGSTISIPMPRVRRHRDDTPLYEMPFRGEN